MYQPASLQGSHRIPAGNTRVIPLLAALVATVAVAAPPSPVLKIQSIHLASEVASTQVELALSRAATFNVFTLNNPDRVVLDLASGELATSALPLPTGVGAIRQVRAGRRPGGGLRLVFDVRGPVNPQASLGMESGSPTLALELRPAAWVGTNPPVPAPAAVAAAPMAEASSRTGLTRADPPRPIVVAVDAGHGGHDPGARGPTGLREKDITLAISRELVGLINAEPGMRGVLTRSDDQFVVLRTRMEKARAANADLFVSIHADAAQNRGARGSTVYVLSAKGATDEASRRLAARENAALIGGVDLGDKDPVLASVLMDLSQNASISSSIAVGEAVLARMGQLGHLHRTAVQQAPFMVLKSPDVPSILVETAYITNPADETDLRSTEHRQRLSRAILGGIRQYFTTNPPTGAVLTARN